jgi:hypothetical protein
VFGLHCSGSKGSKELEEVDEESMARAVLRLSRAGCGGRRKFEKMTLNRCILSAKSCARRQIINKVSTVFMGQRASTNHTSLTSMRKFFFLLFFSISLFHLLVRIDVHPSHSFRSSRYFGSSQVHYVSNLSFFLQTYYGCQRGVNRFTGYGGLGGLYCCAAVVP